jgi:hypothetical protein
MHKIDAPNADGANEFTDGDSALGLLATVLWSKWLNTVQRELVAVVEGAGLTLSDANDAQVLAAIQTLLTAHSGLINNPHTVTKAQVGLGSVADIPQPIFVNVADGAPDMSSVVFDVDANVANGGWESVGPSGSGATNTWTAMNSVPNGSTWVELSGILVCTCYLDTPDVQRTCSMAFRRTGSSLPSSERTRRLHGSFQVGADGGGGKGFYSTNTFRVPIDANRRFDVSWGSNFNNTNLAHLYLVGCGRNA